MTARPLDYIEGQDENTATVFAMVHAIDDATAALDALPLVVMSVPSVPETPATRDYRAALLRAARAELSATLRGALDRFNRVGNRKLAALAGVKP